MQKNWCLVFVFVLLVGFVAAIDVDSIGQQLGSVDERVQNITTQVENTTSTMTDEQARSAYLKQRFTKVVENQPGFKQIISAYRLVSPYSDPVIKYCVGMVPELSLFFILVLVIWFFLVKYFFTIYEVLRDFSTFSKEISLIVSICLFVMFIAIHFFQSLSLFFANKIIALTELLTSPLAKIVAFVVFVVAIVFLSKFSKQVSVVFGKIRESLDKGRKMKKEEEMIVRQKSATETVEEYAEALNRDK